MSSTEIQPTEVDETALAALGDDFDDGLEDFDTDDMVMPRITIEHQEGVFVDALSGEKHEEMDVVLLGLVKQRIMWSDDVDDDSGPLCKSVDAKVGNPRDEFPWEESGFAKTAGKDQLPCNECNFSKWQNNNPPPCSEQFTLPLMMNVEGQGYIAPAIITFQRSGAKPVKRYLTSFKRSQMPLFTAKTKLSLDVRKKGSVTFSVPQFEKSGQTESDYYGMFAENYKQIREYLHQLEVSDPNDEEAVGTSEAANDSENSDEDLPF